MTEEFTDPLAWVVVEHSSHMDIAHRYEQASWELRQHGTVRPLFIVRRFAGDDLRWCGECWSDNIDDYVKEFPGDTEDPMLNAALSETLNQLKENWRNQP